MKSTRRNFRYSSFRSVTGILLAFLLLASASAQDRTLKLDERPAQPGEWGYRPAARAVSRMNPPAFSWRPQAGVTWEIECARGKGFDKIEYRAKDLEFNIHCPPRTFESGTYTWRYRGKDKNGRYTRWSQPRTFTIAADAAALPLPAREELIARIPKSHPRLFMRPENLDRLRESARDKMKAEYNALVRDCEKLLSRPPATREPPTYPKGTVR
ncbi:MAG: DUF4962 domain-containing protein, partial [Planctomycetota bacterium]|nr:DUF4962 domain-containing protein [Planctomycetota bacterium]